MGFFFFPSQEPMGEETGSGNAAGWPSSLAREIGRVGPDRGAQASPQRQSSLPIVTFLFIRSWHLLQHIYRQISLLGLRTAAALSPSGLGNSDTMPGRQSRLAQEANPSYFVLNPPRRSHLHKSRPSSWHSPPACTCLPMCGAELSTRGERYGIFSPAWSSWKGLVTVTLYYSLQVSPGDCNPHTRTHSFCCYLRTCLPSPNTCLQYHCPVTPCRVDRACQDRL